MKCPGQDSRYWSGEDVFETPCPNCGAAIEFFKDEARRRCKACGHQVLNPRMDFGCAAYCPYAEQCLGELPEELRAQKKEMLHDQVAVAMKQYFGSDFRRIAHAGRVARYAAEIQKIEGGNPGVIMAAAYLHDIGIKEAERQYNSTAARYQHELGPPIARRILEELDAEPGFIDEVCDIVGHHHHPRPEETVNFKVVYDADLIVNLADEAKEGKMDRDKLARLVERSFLTEGGRRVAAGVLLEDA